MKSVLMLLAGLVLLVLVFFSGVIITANVISVPEPHKFTNIETPDLWTSKPKAIDTAGQSLERIPGATQSVESVAASAAALTGGVNSGPAVDKTVTAAIDSTEKPADASTMPQMALALPNSGALNSIGNVPAEPQSLSPVDAAQAEWCHARYRSYWIEDNSYQPYDGSARRQCQAPGMAQGGASVNPGAPTMQAVASASTGRRALNSAWQDQMQPRPPETIPYTDETRQVYEDQPYESATQAVNAAAPSGSHEDWCFGRYRSYRIDDNSYQPFEGGPRRQCQSPFG